MNILVCGFGSIGKRHVDNLLSLTLEVSVWKPSFTDIELKTLFGLGVKSFVDLSIALQQADAVVIASPPEHHVAIFNAAILACKHVYLEKPVSYNINSISNMLIPSADIVIEIGCQLRNHPALLCMREYLSNESKVSGYRFEMGHRLSFWRKNYNYSNSYTSDNRRGGGAMLELIHMIDLSLWLFGSVKKVACLATNRGILDLNCDDYTILMVEHLNGIVGTIQLDMTAPAYHCQAQCIAAKYIYRFDLISQTLLGLGSDGDKTLFYPPHNYSRNDLFLTHIDYFVKRILDPSLPPICSLNEGIESLKVAFKSFESFDKGVFVSM